MLSSIQISIPEELANRLKPMQEQIPHILELGLRRFNASAQYAFEGADDVLEFLAGLPEPEDIMKLHPSESFQARISSLLEKTGILVCLCRRKGNGRSISILNIWYAWQRQKPVSD